MTFGGFEWVLISLTILFLFGAKGIPEFARGLGQGIKEFRKTSESLKKSRQEIRDSLKHEESDKKNVDK